MKNLEEEKVGRLPAQDNKPVPKVAPIENVK
jgi:hypothetical protein